MSELNLKKDKSKGKSKSKSFSQSFQESYDYDNNESNLNDQKIDENINFLEETEISKEREKIISEAKDKLFLERDEAILAMI